MILLATWLSCNIVIETIVNQAYERLFVFSTIGNVFRIHDSLAIAAVEMVLILLATWLSCNKLLKKPAIELLRGDSGSLGRTHFYEKMRWWKKCSLYTQTTINNLANDAPRVIATLVGVAVEGAQENLCSVIDDKGVDYTSVRQEAIFIKDTTADCIKQTL